jgi:hypothetical protein
MEGKNSQILYYRAILDRLRDAEAKIRKDERANQLHRNQVSTRLSSISRDLHLLKPEVEQIESGIIRNRGLNITFLSEEPIPNIITYFHNRMPLKEKDLYGLIDKDKGPIEFSDAGRRYEGLLQEDTEWNYVLRSEAIPRAYGLKVELYTTTMSNAQFNTLSPGVKLTDLDAMFGTTTTKVTDVTSCHVKTTLIDVENLRLPDISAKGLKATPEYSGLLLSTLRVLLAMGSVVVPEADGILGPAIAGIGALQGKLDEFAPQVIDVLSSSQSPLGNIPLYDISTNGDYISINSNVVYDTWAGRRVINEDKAGYRTMQDCTQSSTLYYLRDAFPNLTSRLSFAKGFDFNTSKETADSAWNYSNLGNAATGTVAKIFGTAAFGAIRTQYQIKTGVADYNESTLKFKLPSVGLGGDGLYNGRLQYSGNYTISSSMVGRNNIRYTVPQYNLVVMNGKPIARFDGIDPHLGTWNLRTELLNNIV